MKVSLLFFLKANVQKRAVYMAPMLGCGAVLQGSHFEGTKTPLNIHILVAITYELQNLWGNLLDSFLL